MVATARISSPVRPSEVPMSQNPKGTLGWALEAVAESEQFIESQPGIDRIKYAMDAIMGEDAPKRPTGLSQTYVNEIGRIARVLIAMLTDTKPFWEYRSYNSSYEQSAITYGKLATNWYTGHMGIDQKWADVIRYYTVAGTGIAHQIWNAERRDIDVIPRDPRDFLPFRPAGNYVQDAVGGIIREALPLNIVRTKWPQFGDAIKADRDGGWESNANSRLGRVLGKLKLGPIEAQRQRRGMPYKQPGGNFPVVDVYYFYFNDDSTNDTKAPVGVGEFLDKDIPLNNWSYMVQPGDQLYPRRRMLVFTRNQILYDGPNIYWHGQIPVTKITLDPWPWTWLGVAPLWDLLPLQDSLNKSLRARDDHIQKVMRPNVFADNQTISKSELRKYDPRRGGQKILTSPFGKGVQEQEVKPLDPSIRENIEFCLERMQTGSGVMDLTNLTKLGQMPSGDTVDAMVQAMTPDIRGRSRMLEVAVRDFAMQFAYNVTQWYTLKRRYAILGKDGVTIDDFDFDPSTLVPSYTDSDYDEAGNVIAERLDRPRPRYDRARESMRQITFRIPPASLLKAAEMTDKLMYLQLARMGFMDIQSLLEKLDIPNVGDLLSGPVLARIMKQTAMGIGPAVGPAGAAQGGGPGPASHGGGPGSNPETRGRKASGQDAPKMRPDGKISESG